MPARDIYLKIDQIADYSPVDPDSAAPPPIRYRRDCMRTPGHENGTIPPAEVSARTLTALVYREYLDPSYIVPKPDKLVLADINEPPFHRRVPGTVIYAQPGDRLRIHVFNADMMPHSFHMHGLEYGIDSDGSWPFGTQSSDGRRSDEICPGETWTYTFNVTGEMIGAWPFHDHHRMVSASVDRGLFGGVVVRPPGEDLPARSKLPAQIEKLVEELGREPWRGRGGHGRDRGRGHRHPDLEVLPEILDEWAHGPHSHPRPKPSAVLHVPLFFHVLRGSGTPAFDSGDLNNGDAFESTFGVGGEFRYHCEHHPNMRGTVRVTAGSPSLATVRILDPPASPEMKFDPETASVGPGGIVRWEHAGTLTHTVTEDGVGLPSFCFNGRVFVGNTPTILAEAGQKIRWYVFNLDLGMTWHNFHPHAQRWKFANETIDVRSLGPAESFVVETAGPPVLLHHLITESERDKREDERGRRREYRLAGDFLFHCHVEMHMMGGMAGLVRSRQTVRLTQAEADQIAADTGLPIDPGDNSCPSVALDRCETMDMGIWEEVTGNAEITMMHAALLPKTSKVLYWGYGPRSDHSRLWDAGGTYSLPANQPVDVAADEDIWSSEHAFLDTPDGTLLVHGGYVLGGPMPPLSSNTERLSFLFDPAFVDPGTGRTGRWLPTRSPSTALTAEARFYATTLTLDDGRVLTLYGSNLLTGAVSRSIEIFNPSSGTWDPPKSLPTADTDGVSWAYLYYPWTYLLPGGHVFIAGPQAHTRRFDWTVTPIPGDPTRRWSTNAGGRGSNMDGTSVLLPLRPPNYEPRVLIAGGVTGSVTINGVTYDIAKTAEMIDLSQASPAWILLPVMNYRRTDLTAVLLPDGRVFVAGGVIDPVPDGGPAEIFDPEDPSAGWIAGPSMTYRRGYHSAAILLPDGSVLVGGDPNPSVHERYFPGYYFKPRPRINPGGTPPSISYGVTFTIQTPDASAIDKVVLLRPGAVTHGFNMSQRFVECDVVSRAANSIQAQAPPDSTVAPRGYYLVFIVTAGRVPSVGEWIRLTP